MEQRSRRIPLLRGRLVFGLVLAVAAAALVWAFNTGTTLVAWCAGVVLFSMVVPFVLGGRPRPRARARNRPAAPPLHFARPQRHDGGLSQVSPLAFQGIVARLFEKQGYSVM